MSRPPRAYNHSFIRGIEMSKPPVLIAAAFALLSGTYGASAFTTEPANPVTINNRLVDPDELADKMSNGQSSGGTLFGLPGGPSLQFSAPSSSGGVNSRFVTSPSTVYVPSEHR
jgi:hypothetical protein